MQKLMKHHEPLDY